MMDVDPSSYTAAQVYEQILSIIEANEEKHRIREQFSEKAIETARTEMDHRLAGMNEIRGALADLSGTMVTRAESDTAIHALATKLEADIDGIEAKTSALVQPLRSKMEDLTKTNWPQYISLGGLLLGIVAGGWVVVGLKIDSNNSPVLLAVEQIKVAAASNNQRIGVLSDTVSRVEAAVTSLQQEAASTKAIRDSSVARINEVEQRQSASTQADTISRQDRNQLNDRTRALEAAVANESSDRKEAQATIKTSLTEIETQFKNIGNILNILVDDYQQWLGIIYEKVFPGQTLPVTRFRPYFHKDGKD
jgi:hypothetical protein